MKWTCFLLPALFIGVITTHCQTTIPYNLQSLTAVNRKVTVNGNSIHMAANDGYAVAWLNGVNFSNGIIEVDIKGKDLLQQSFVGIAFHGVDDSTHEAVYFRPFNFKATDSVRKIHAVEYVSHPDFPWETLREKFNGQYEKGIDPAPNPNDWFHAKIVVVFPAIEVFVNGNKTASLSVAQISKRTNGRIGFWVGNNSEGDFKNLLIKAL